MIRAVFFDIDGTLVSLKTKRCPDSTKAAIRALREKGIRVYVASGRSRFELEEQEMLRGMTFDGYLTNNGQIVYDGSWNLLRTVAMVPDEVRALVDYCDERSLPLWLVSEQRSRFTTTACRSLWQRSIRRSRSAATCTPCCRSRSSRPSCF